MENTTYIRYTEVQIGDAVKLVDGFIWRDRRTAEKHEAPFITISDIRPGRYPDSLTLIANGQTFDKPKTSKALVLA